MNYFQGENCKLSEAQTKKKAFNNKNELERSKNKKFRDSENKKYFKLNSASILFES